MQGSISKLCGVGATLAAARLPAVLVIIGLGTGGSPVPVGATESAQADPEREARPVPRWSHSATVVDGKIYVMGGWGADNRPVAAVEVYDPATGEWAARASMPTARALFGASAVGGRIYAVGGTTFGADKLAVVEAYDPATDTWTRRADMPTPRNALSTAVVDERIYAIGGWGFDRPEGGWTSLDPTAEAQDFATVEVYDPETDTWNPAEDMPTPRSHMTVSAVGGKIYAIGGWLRRGGVDVALSLMEVYDTADNRWTPAADMPTPRWVPSSGVIDGRIYVAGGTVGGGTASSRVAAMRKRRPLSAVEVYDPVTGRWTSEADLATPRGWLSATVVNGRLFVIGGRSEAPEGEVLEVMGTFRGVEVYTPTGEALSEPRGR